MTLRFPVLAAALLAGCAGGQYAQNLTVASAAPAPDAFACVRDQIKALGFTQSSYDTDELRVTARKNNESVRRPDVQFRRLVDRLEVDVAPGAGGEVSRISVVARTLAELTTHRGPTEEEEKPSETVRAAAQAIADKCGGEMRPAADTAVPPS
jgi:hypothetical protein